MLSDLNIMRNPSIVSAQQILLANIIVVVVASTISLGNELTAQSDARNLDTYHDNKDLKRGCIHRETSVSECIKRGLI
jgi:hypothetical protein